MIQKSECDKMTGLDIIYKWQALESRWENVKIMTK